MVWLPPNRIITSVTFILFVCALVGTVHANSVTPPGGITICGYVTYANEIGIWWFNPYEPDFAGVQMWLDDQYLGTSKPADHFHNAYSAVIGTHTFSTHTFDNSGNVNSTWVNLTFLTKEYPGCTENWTCDTCSLPLIPVAAFSANPTYGTVPLAVQFTDTSTNAPTGWNWSFGDGNYTYPPESRTHLYICRDVHCQPYCIQCGRDQYSDEDRVHRCYEPCNPSDGILHRNSHNGYRPPRSSVH